MSDTTKKILIIIGVILTGLIITIAAIISYGFGVYNQANTFEKALVAERDNNKNILSNYGKKVLEAVQVPDMQRDDFMKIITAQMQGRYGKEGSKATFQFLQEQAIVPDTKVYSKIQQLIESGRNEFQSGQTKLVSVKQGYTTMLDSAPRGVFMKMMGYPKINLADFDIVSDDRTENAFNTHKEAPLKLR